MTIRICSHHLSMQSDVINDQAALSNEIDCSTPLSTKLIYSGLKLHPKPLVPTISMPSMANQLSIVKKLSLSDPNGDNSTKSLTTSLKHASTASTTTVTAASPSIRLVTSTTGKSSPPTNLQFQFVDKSSTSNGAFQTPKAYIFNPQQSSSSSNSQSVVTLIPPGTGSPKLQTLISSNNDLLTTSDLNSNSKTASFFTKSRVTLVQPIITSSSSPSSSSMSTATNSVTPKLVIQQNPTSNIWSSQSTTKFVSTKVLAHPLQLISSSEHSTLSSPTANDNPILATKPLDSGHQTYIQMPLLPQASPAESIHPVSLANFYSTPSTVRLATARSMDHNNNHSVTTPIVREMTIEEKINDSSTVKATHPNKNSFRNKMRLPLQPSAQQTSSILTATRKHKLPDDELNLSVEPPNKFRHVDSVDPLTNGKKLRRPRQRQLSKISIENTTPNSASTLAVPSSTSSIGVDTNEMVISKKRSSAEIAAAAILSSSHLKRKRMSKKNVDQTPSTVNVRPESEKVQDLSIETIDDELLKRLSQDFVYVDQRTGLSWIATKTRTQPMGTLLSRFSWKPKINHYEKYTDVIRMNSKRAVPIKNPDTLRKRLFEPWASWRIERLTSYLNDLTEDEQLTQENLSDIDRLMNQLKIENVSFEHAVHELIEDNIQRHRSFSEQLTQISSLLNDLLSHGNTLREISSPSKLTNPVPTNNVLSTSRRTKER